MKLLLDGPVFNDCQSQVSSGYILVHVQHCISYHTNLLILYMYYMPSLVSAHTYLSKHVLVLNILCILRVYGVCNLELNAELELPLESPIYS